MPLSPMPIIDSALSFEQVVAGSLAPPHILGDLALLDVEHWSFDARLHRGQIVVHRALAAEVAAIFAEIGAARFPIEKVLPTVRYNWSDDASMADNNSSSFNYRRAVGLQQMSQHAFGRAIDLNPRQNPYIKGDIVLPPNATYNPTARGTIVPDDVVVRAFLSRGWDWGGAWTRLQDYQHFEKRA